MFASIFDPIRRAFAHPQWAWIGLWIGLAFLIVALIVMIRTNWGQSHPLRKCAALSLLAHLLLAVYQDWQPRDHCLGLRADPAESRSSEPRR